MAQCFKCEGTGEIGDHFKSLSVCDECFGSGNVPSRVERVLMPVTMQVQPSGITVKIKKLHEDATIPVKAHASDAGFDITCIDDGVDVYPVDDPGNTYFYRSFRTGLAFEIPPGHVGYIFPRSSVSNTGLFLANAVGVIDSGYRGEVTFRFKVDGAGNVLKGAQRVKSYCKGDKIGQLIIMPLPQTTIEIVDELSEADRGDNGYGSTGK